VTEKGYAFYKVRVETERGYFERGPMHYLLYPGVQVMTSILIGQRSVLEYLLTPYFNAMNTALQER
jgi:adhesin transport system membrane fusion protein